MFKLSSNNFWHLHFISKSILYFIYLYYCVLPSEFLLIGENGSVPFCLHLDTSLAVFFRSSLPFCAKTIYWTCLLLFSLTAADNIFMKMLSWLLRISISFENFDLWSCASQIFSKIVSKVFISWICWRFNKFNDWELAK